MLKKYWLTAALVIGLSGLSVIAEDVKEVVIIGNSIRQHGKAPQIGWNYDWGMAATSQDKDYVHVLYKKICDKLAKTQKNAPKLSLPGGVVEKDFSKWDPGVTKNADIIIVQLGDNFRNPLTEEKLQKPYEAMLKDLKGDRNPVIICVSNWGGGKMSELISEAAKNQGAKFVPLEKLAADPLNKAKSEGRFSHGGVNWHPGDRGMEAIANAIWVVLEPELDKSASK
jgi:hypothetical protein